MASWLNELEDANFLSDQLYSEIHSSAGTNSKSAKNSALSKKVQELSRAISSLKHGVDRDNSISQKEASRRRELLQQLAQKRDFYEDSLSGGGKPSGAFGAAAAAGRAAHGAMTSNLPPGGFQGRDSEYYDMSPEEQRRHIGKQEQVMGAQDNALDKLSEQVSMLNQIGHAINDEADLHTRMLGDVERATDKTHNKLRKEQRSLDILMRKENRGCMCFIIFFLFLALVGIIYLAVHTGGATVPGDNSDSDARDHGHNGGGGGGGGGDNGDRSRNELVAALAKRAREAVRDAGVFKSKLFMWGNRPPALP